MVLDIDQSDRGRINELIQTSRVNDFTLSVFMTNIWINSMAAMIIFAIFFFCCRLWRNDKERFIQKLHRLQQSSLLDSDDDEYDQNLKLMQLDTTLRTSRLQNQQMGVESNNLLRVNVANMNPLSIVQIIDDPTMFQMFGRDRFLYLKFLKYQSWFFLTLFFLGWTILMPTYYSGEDAAQYINSVMSQAQSAGSPNNTSTVSPSPTTSSIQFKAENAEEINLLEFTILNVKEAPDKLMISYIFTVLTTIVMYVSIYCFWRGTRTWFKKTKKHEIDDMGYSQLNMHCLLLKGIPTHMSPREAQSHIKRVLNMVNFPSEWQVKDQPKDSRDKEVFDVKVVEVENEFFNLKKKLQSLNKQIALSHRFEKLLEQREYFMNKTPLQRDKFLKHLDKQELTSVPFYKMRLHYFDSHRREVKDFTERIHNDLGAIQYRGEHRSRPELRRSATGVSPDKRTSPDKRKRPQSSIKNQ